MKLFTKYSRVNIIASILALLLGSIGYYFTVRYVLIHQLDEALKIEEAEILDFTLNRGQLPELIAQRHDSDQYRKREHLRTDHPGKAEHGNLDDAGHQ